MYQSEIAPERIRGKLISLQQLCITFGILLAACANVGLEKWEEVSSHNLTFNKLEVYFCYSLLPLSLQCIVAYTVLYPVLHHHTTSYETQGWRISYCGNGILSALLVVLMFFCPESPRWLHKVGRNAEARATLHKVRHSHYCTTVVR
jgi:MFS family permease